MSRNVLDLFAGAGGMALGFHAAGARCLGAVEMDEAASRTFQHNFRAGGPQVFGGPVNGDVNQLPVDELLDRLPALPDIVVGGPPCQGFSRIGRAKQRSLLESNQKVLSGGVRDPHRNQLYRYFLGVVSKARPMAFVMENVPGMRDILGVDHAGRIAREAASLGYNVRYFLLNAVHYGVPQYRWRLFFVGMRRDLGHGAIPAPPVRTHRSAGGRLEGSSYAEDPWLLAGDLVPERSRPRPAVTAFEALGDLPRLTGHLDGPDHKGTQPQDVRLPFRRKPSKYAQLMRKWPGLGEPETVSGNWYRWTPRDFGTFREMAEGDRYSEALCVANRRMQKHLDELSDSGMRPGPGSEREAEIRKSFIPPYRNDAFADKWRKLLMDEPSWTVTAHLGKDTYSHIHYDSRQARSITVREAARIQSFPDAFEFQGNNGQKFKQIGNAVPPLLAKALATQLFTQLDGFHAIGPTGPTLVN